MVCTVLLIIIHCSICKVDLLPSPLHLSTILFLLLLGGVRLSTLNYYIDRF